jgi:hypothetical protein
MGIPSFRVLKPDATIQIIWSLIPRLHVATPASAAAVLEVGMTTYIF